MISKSVPYRLSWAIWLIVAIPAFALSFWLLGEPPLWPPFSEEATPAGIAIWALFAAVFYGFPLYLLAASRLGRKIKNDHP